MMEQKIVENAVVRLKNGEEGVLICVHEDSPYAIFESDAYDDEKNEFPNWIIRIEDIDVVLHGPRES